VTELNEMIGTYEGANAKLLALLPVADNLSRHTFLTHFRWHAAILQDLYQLRDKVGSPDEISFILKRSPEDEPQFSREYQADMGKVFTAFHNEGIKIKKTFFTLDAVDAVGGATGEFLAFAKILGPATVAAVGVWLAGRNGRKVKIKVGEIEAEANSVEQLDEVLERVGRIKRDNEPKRIHEE
jgi:hypothetical protein